MLKKFLIGTFVLAALAFLASTASADCSIVSTLRVGSTGAEVACLQAKVGATADGSFGPLTKASVMAYQSNHGLSADGVVGPLSRAVLNGSPAASNFPAGCTNTSGFSTTTGFSCKIGFPTGCTNASGFSITTGLACSSLNANTFPTGCTNASGFSITTGYSCLTGLLAVRSGGSSGSSHHHTALTEIAITGTLKVGEVLTADVTPSGATVDYQWQRGDIAGGESYPNIEGATESTYTILESDVGKYFDVTATGTGNYSGSVKSASTTVIAPAIIASATATSPSPAIGDAGINATVDVGVNYTHTSTVWSGRAGATYVTGETPIAVITLAPKTGYTFFGFLATGITVTGGTVTYEAEQGVLGGGTSVVFTVTYPQLTTVGVGTAAATGGTYTIVYTLATGTFDATAGIVNGNWTIAGTNGGTLGAITGVVLSSGNAVATITVTNAIGAVGQVYTIAPATAAFATGYTAPAAATVTVSAAAPVIATTSTIVTGAVNPTITVTGTNFKPGIVGGDLNVGNFTNGSLNFGGVTFTSGTEIIVSLTGTVGSSGYVTIQARTSAFNPAGTSVSNELTVNVTAAPATGDMAFVLTTPAENGTTNKLTVNQSGSPKLVNVDVVRDTSSVVITGTKTIAQTAVVSGADLGNVITTESDTAPIYTVNMAAPGDDVHLGGNKTFLLTVSEAGKSDIVYVVTVQVSSALNPVTSAVFTTSTATTTITITLAQGSFKAAPIVAADFTFTGTNATVLAALTAGAFNRTSDTAVTIIGSAGYLAGGTDNRVTVLGATQTSQVITVTGTAS